ncbi:MAG: tRNA (guanosine(37)-N1)-methyltransferase TrmD [Patescibacteria group bacterium]
MQIDILSLFPEMFQGVFEASIVGRAINRKLLKLNICNFRQFTLDKHHTVDDRPFGGGVGMILKIEPIYKALKSLKLRKPGTKIILLSPQGKPFTQREAKRLSKYKRLVLICGHYEGVDERVGQKLADEQLSIGDYVLTGGEIPAMVVTDAVTRLLPRVLSKSEATTNESFQPCTLHPKPYTLLEAPQYTRPAKFLNKSVPKVLLCGNHEKIKAWRLKEALKKTRKLRPDLLKRV